MSQEEGEPVQVLIVEDDPVLAALVAAHLRSAGCEITIAPSGNDAVRQTAAVAPDVICLDLGLPDGPGDSFVNQFRRNAPLAPFIVITGDHDVDTIVRTMKLGAFDYLVKPVEKHRLVQAVLAAAASTRQLRSGRHVSPVRPPGILGKSAATMRLIEQMRRVSATDIGVLLVGESGTGKELVAQGIHALSSRATGPFIPVNCAAIPESLQESTLFGHERGAFTGANARTPGCFEQADGGTLFLDEVAELRADAQAKLLRAVQEKRFHRVGGQTEVQSSFRLIAASHVDLTAAVERRAFREDLYFRLSVFELEVPPLRERAGDVELLAHHFCRRFARDLGRTISLSPEVVGCLLSYDWPGNVRELQNAIHRACVAASGRDVRLADLPPRLVAPLRLSEARMAADEAPVARPAPSASALAPTTGDKQVPLEAVERQAILAALENNGGNMTAAAAQLGIGRTTLYRKLKRYRLEQT